jgi:hypothetical protein
MSYIGQTLPADTFQGFTTDSFAGDGSATTFTLSKTPFNESALLVVINNVVQKPTTNFTVSGTTLTIVGTAVASGDVIYATHIGGALPIGQAASLDLNGASDQLILDADADTTITADTDDQIDFKAGGTDVMSMTATGLTINDGTTITTADNTDTLSLISTDADANVGPNLNLYRNSSSPADNDTLGQLAFVGRNDNSQDFNAFQMTAYSSDVSDGTEDGTMQMFTMQNGSLHLAMQITPTETVFNDSSKDQDFRVEGNGDANAFFVEGSTDHIGMGTNDPDSPLHVHVGSAGSVTAFDTTGVTIEDSDNATLNFLSPDASQSRILFGSPSDNVGASIKWSHDSNAFEIKGGTGSSELQLGGAQSTQMIIHQNGNVGIGNTGGDYRLKVESNADNSYAFNLINSHGSNAYGQYIRYSAYAPDGGTNHFFFCGDTTANRLFIRSDGDIINHDNSYGQISDERIKQDIRDSNSQWDDIKAVKVRNFKRKDDVRQYGDKAWEQIGVVAQELETAGMDKLIKSSDPSSGDILSDSSFGTLYTSDDSETQDGIEEVLYTATDQEVIDGNVKVGDIKIESKPSTKQIGDVKEVKEQVKSVKYSILYMKAIKALQEAMAKIETLETKVKALEDA